MYLCTMVLVIQDVEKVVSRYTKIKGVTIRWQSKQQPVISVIDLLLFTSPESLAESRTSTIYYFNHQLLSYLDTCTYNNVKFYHHQV